LPVADPPTRHAQPAQHPVPRGDTRVRGPAERGLEAAPADSRGRQRGPHRVHAEVGHRGAVEAAERMDADTRELDRRSHAPASGTNAYVTTVRPSSSVWRGTTSSRTAWPSVSRAGSGSTRRV